MFSLSAVWDTRGHSHLELPANRSTSAVTLSELVKGVHLEENGTLGIEEGGDSALFNGGAFRGNANASDSEKRCES